MEFLGLRIAVPSGGSLRVTIPAAVLQKIWCGERRALPICFFRDGERLLIIPFDEVMRSDLPRDVKERVYEDWRRRILGIFQRRMTELMDRLVRGEIHWSRFTEELERLQEKAMDEMRPFASKISGSLAFLPDGADVILSAALAAQDTGEALDQIVEELREIAEERRRLREILKHLDSADIEEAFREIIAATLRSELEIMEERLNEIRKLLEG